jgi:hypothetical protein
MEFNHWTDKLARRWHRRPMSTDEANDWFEELEKIPSEAWQEICHNIWKTAKYHPTPQDLESAWFSWLSERPERQHRETREEPCDDCLGRGCFVVCRRDKPDHEAVILCASCQNYVYKFGTDYFMVDKRKIYLARRTRFQVQDAAFTILHPSDKEIAWHKAGEDQEERRVTKEEIEEQIPF